MKEFSNLNLESCKSTYLRLSITDQCDLNCAYCRPVHRPVTSDGPPLTAAEIAILVEAFAPNGITKVRLTGGEPLVRDDVVEIVRSIASTPGIGMVGLTTNGTRFPELASDLAGAGLQAVNISLDTLSPETFRRIAGRDRLHEVLNGIDAALRCGFQKVKINTVVMRGINHHELPEIAGLARTMPVDVRFIELMPLGRSTQEWQAMYVPAHEIREVLGALSPATSENSASARHYSIPGGKGVIGIISPMSEPFCGECNRIRVTSSGKLKPCLRLPGEVDIRSSLHEPDFVSTLGELLDRLCCDKLSEASSSTSAVGAEAMCSIGG